MNVPYINPIVVPEPDRMGQMGNLMNMMVVQRLVDNIFNRMGTLKKAKPTPKETAEKEAEEAAKLAEENRNLNFLADKTQTIEDKIAEQKRLEDFKAMSLAERWRNAETVKPSSLKYFRNSPPKESLKDQLLTLQKEEDEFQKTLPPTKGKKPPSELEFYMKNPAAWERQKQIESINKILNPPQETTAKAEPSKPKPSKPARKKEMNPLELSMRIAAFNQNRNR